MASRRWSPAGRTAAAFVAAAALSGRPASGAGPDFDRAGAEPLVASLRDAASGVGETNSAEEAVWVSVARSDVHHPRWSGLGLGVPAAQSARASVYRLDPSRLPELSQYMHDRFGRCGGFFAYGSREEAEEDLRAPRSTAGGPYTLDREAFVRPILEKVRETELRSTIESLAAYHNRYYQSETGVAAASWIQARWQQLAAALPGASANLVPHGNWKQPSVVLTVPGSDKPDEVVVLGGHLDSIAGWMSRSGSRAPGADDNASGIAVLTEAIRVLADSGFRPSRTVQFMGYAAEEVGLRGSNEIARQYAREGRRVAGVIQFDMTNFKGSAENVYLLSDNVDPELTAFLAKLVETYLGFKAPTTACGYGCSDHASWTKSGFPASAAFESAFNGMNRNIHTDRDTLANSGGSAQHSVSFAKLAVAFASEIGKAAVAKPRAVSGR
ncbi:MAG: M20/M25/M40 family metallo-hydrolase [Elusimicrobia bacterium]|nr:M20/M25/M40 family metallo-hydrolase [Elusimicrobiota bacterium]